MPLLTDDSEFQIPLNVIERYVNYTTPSIYMVHTNSQTSTDNNQIMDIPNITINNIRNIFNPPLILNWNNNN